MRKVIVAPLNWGLGHASRCIPVIKALQKEQLTPVIASDGSMNYFKRVSRIGEHRLPSYNFYGKYLNNDLFKNSLSS